MQEDDIMDPQAHVDINNLNSYSKDHFRLPVEGVDSLEAVGCKNIRSRVLQYFKNNIAIVIVDPTPELKWKTREILLGENLRNTVADLNEVPNVLKEKLGVSASTDG